MKSIVKTLFLLLLLLALVGFLSTLLKSESGAPGITAPTIEVDISSIVFGGTVGEQDPDETPIEPSEPILDKESIIGTWVFNDTVTFDFSGVIRLNFESGEESYSSMAFLGTDVYYNGTTLAYSSTGFRSSDYKTITVTEFNGDDADFEAFSTFLIANATKQL